MKLKQLVVTAATALALVGAAYGGTVVPVSEEIETPNSIAEWTTGSLSVGYDSTYIFRGKSFGEDAAWSAIDISAPLLDSITLNASAFYVNATDSDFDFDKLILKAGLSAPVGSFDLGVDYIANLFPGNSADTNDEIAVTLSSGVGVLDLGVAGVYNFDSEQYYFEGQVGTGFVLTDTISAEVDVEVAFNEDEYSHTVARLSLPVRLSDSVTFTPYGAGIFRDEDVWADESADEFIAGAHLSVSF